MKRFFAILRAAAVAVLLLLLSVNLYLIAARFLGAKEPVTLFGYSHSIVLSGSMEPEFSAGDLLFFREEEHYSPQDIVIFQASDGSLVTHRILREEEGGFVTKGDANNTEDGVQPYSAIRGRMVAVVPSVGHFLLFLRSPFGVFVIIAAGILLLESPKISQSLRKKEKEMQVSD